MPPISVSSDDCAFANLASMAISCMLDSRGAGCVQVNILEPRTAYRSSSRWPRQQVCLRSTDPAALLLPNTRLGPAELGEFGRAQRRLCDREELVELWRCHRRAAEHCVRLAAMVDLVLEQM